MATTTIKNSAGADVTVELPLAPGRAAAAASRPVALSIEDAAFLDGLEGFLGTIAGAISGGRMLTSPAALVAGTNNIGDVDVLSLPATPAGTNIIGRVGIDQTTDGTTNLVAAKQSGTWNIATVTPGTGATNLGKAEDAVHASGDVGVMALGVQVAAPTAAAANGDYAAVQITNGRVNVAASAIVTATSSITRPADTAQYAAGDALANSTSAPTAGGGTFTGVTSVAGGSAILTDLMIVSSNAPATPMQGEVWLFDTAPTAMNDNAAWSLSDAEALTLVDVIPFALTTIGNNSLAAIQRGTGITTVGSANLRFLIRVVNAYTPASGEVITIRAKFQQVN